MKSPLKLAFCAALLAAAAHCTGAFAQAPKFADLKAGTYQIEPYHTQVMFSVLHFGISNFSGMFAGASGTLQLDPTHLAASNLTVSVAVATLSTTVPVLTQELKGHAWFDVEQFPTATFVSTSFVAVGTDSAKVTGNLTLHGVTKPVTMNVQLVGANVNPLSKAYSVGVEVSGTFKRSDFGIAMDIPAVGDSVRLRIAGAFEAKP